MVYNHLEEDITITRGDIKEAARLYGGSVFDVVTTNPPYMMEATGLPEIIRQKS